MTIYRPRRLTVPLINDAPLLAGVLCQAGRNPDNPIFTVRPARNHWSPFEAINADNGYRYYGTLRDLKEWIALHDGR